MSREIFDSYVPASNPAIEIGIEQLYQEFKARLMQELVAKEPTIYFGESAGPGPASMPGKSLPLVERGQP